MSRKRLDRETEDYRVEDKPTSARATSRVRSGTTHERIDARDSTAVSAVIGAAGAGRIRRSPAPRGTATDHRVVIRRSDDLATAIKARRGEASGQSEEDVVKERATETFVSGRGERETAEAQTVTSDPMIDRLKIADAVSSKNKLGNQGLGALLEQRRRREADQPEMTAPNPSGLDDFQSTRQNLDAAIAKYGEEQQAKRATAEHARDEHQSMTEMLGAARREVDQAIAVATWDTTQLEALVAAAKTEVDKIVEPMPFVDDEVDAKAEAAGNAIGVATQRAVTDVQWMEQLLPHTETAIVEAIAAENKAIMNTRMTQAWNRIVGDGGKAGRDPAAIAKHVDELSQEVDRKTDFDPALAQAKLTGGNNRLKAEVIASLQSKTTIKRSITEILRAETDAARLKKLMSLFPNVDALGPVLTKCTDRDRLERIAANASRDLPALRRVFNKINDGATVEFLLVGEGRNRISALDFWLTNNGQAWAGESGAAPRFLPNGTTKEAIEAVAIPKEGSSGPKPGEYAGNRRFKNSKGPPDMLLPTLTTSGDAITYTEYDIKPYVPGQRGANRFVKGSDGRYYSTTDHYKTFKKFA